MMDEMLLQTVVEKLEDIELLVKHNNQNKTGNELKKISDDIKNLSDRTISSEKINELIKSLNACTHKLKEPVQNIIEHHHHLHKGIWIAIALFIINVFLLTCWINGYNNRMQVRANDYKYRALKTTENENLKKLLYNTDSMYKINPEFFQETVIKKEKFIFPNRLKRIVTQFKKEKL